MDCLETLTEIGIEKSRDYPDEAFRIRGLWRTDLLFRPNPEERAFSYTFLLVQTVAEGACYCDRIPPLEEGYQLLNRDCREVHHDYRCFRVATLDAMYSAFEKHPDETMTMTGTSGEKALWRAGIVAEEIARLLELSGADGGSVVNVGVIGNIIGMLRSRGIQVSATDGDPLLVGSLVHDVNVEGMERTVELVEECDVAAITGMIISTNTMEDIFAAARRGGTKLVMFCETGANLCEEYLGLGVDTAIAEPFPFYIFGGTTRIDVFRKK